MPPAPPQRYSRDRDERIEWQLNQIRANTFVTGLVVGLMGGAALIAGLMAVLLAL